MQFRKQKRKVNIEDEKNSGWWAENLREIWNVDSGVAENSDHLRYLLCVVCETVTDVSEDGVAIIFRVKYSKNK